MSTATLALPCTGHSDLYDAVLFPDDGQTVDPDARGKAAALCGGCPAPCAQKVTGSTAPAVVHLLDEDWLPPAAEGRPLPVPEPTPVRRRKREYVPPTGRDYVKPGQRLAAWSRMAADMADERRTVADIAAQLCVSEDTVRRLIGGAR